MAKSRAKSSKDRKSSIDELVRSILAGNPRSAARVLSLIENRDPLANKVMKRLYSRTGRAHVIGITGSAGSGKSTLIDRMVAEFRRRKKRVGILTVDPSSPYSGGALLGDRVRMRNHFMDNGVFIRSLATRDGQGGLPTCVFEAAQLLDAMGNDSILIETIGIGQNQVGIAGVADTVLLVMTPESGDEIQALKAGVLEIADILVMNKSDLPGSAQTFLYLGDLLGTAGVPLFKTSALNDDGIAPLVNGVEKHWAELVRGGNRKRRILDISRTQLLALIRDRLMVKFEEKLGEQEITRWAQRVASKASDPYTAVETMLAKLHL